MTGHTEMGQGRGVNHRTAPLDVRERLRMARTKCRAPGARHGRGRQRGVLLSTAIAPSSIWSPTTSRRFEAVWSLLGERLPQRPPDGRAREYGYIARDRDAVRHLYRYRRDSTR